MIKKANLEKPIKSSDSLISRKLQSICSQSLSADSYNEYDSESEESDESSIIIRPSEVKFNSLHIVLPSEKESCSLDNINQIQRKV